VSTCGDGVLTEGEACCTPEWVDARVHEAVDDWETEVRETPGCLLQRTKDGVTLCDTAACSGNKTGCHVAVTRASGEYAPASETVSGEMDVKITGHAGGTILFLGFQLAVDCNFVAILNDTEFEADVVTSVTPEKLTLGLAEPVLDYDIVLENCGSGLDDAIDQLARGEIESEIRAQLVMGLKREMSCPY
jgi:hypothetical protein